MATKKPLIRRLTPAALHLLSEIAAGRDRVFYLLDRPNGWTQLERASLVARHPQDDTRAVLTLAGLEFVSKET